MDTTVYSYEVKEVSYSTASSDDEMSWITVRIDSASAVLFIIRDNKENLIFLDQLKAAVDEAIRWARRDVEETTEERPE